MKSYTMRHNATRAARQALGRDAVERVDFHITTSGPDDCIAWHWVAGPAPDPQLAPGLAQAGPAGGFDMRLLAFGQAVEEAMGGPLATESVAADRAPQEPQEAPAAPSGRQTKGGAVLGLLQREQGATNEELQAATGWQPHTVRGFFAGAQMKRTGYKAERFERAPGVHAYRAVKREG